jgi:hypothetical protein
MALMYSQFRKVSINPKCIITESKTDCHFTSLVPNVQPHDFTCYINGSFSPPNEGDFVPGSGIVRIWLGIL